MAGQDLAALLADLTTRQREGPGSRNRAINIYSVNSETIIAAETATQTVSDTPFVWYDGSTTASQASWDLFEWAS